jgi:hypothetical protein
VAADDPAGAAAVGVSARVRWAPNATSAAALIAAMPSAPPRRADLRM